MAVGRCSSVALAILFFTAVHFAITRHDGTQKFYSHLLYKINDFENAKEPGLNFWTPLSGLAGERCGSHCCRLRLRLRLRPRGKGYFASRINRYTNSTSSFELVRLVISGSISPNQGPDKTSVSPKPDKRNRRCQTDPLYNINIAHLDIRSLKNHKHYILAKEAVRANNIDIFAVSETWLDSTVSDIEVEFLGFHLHRLDTSIQTGAGVCIFTKQYFKVECLYQLSYIAASGLHMLWVKIQIRNSRSFLVCTVYKPPDASTLCFDTDQQNSRSGTLNSLNKPIFILGDLNCYMLNENDLACQTLTSFYSSFNLLQLVAQPTRITETSETLIDVLATNGNLVIETKVVPLSIIGQATVDEINSLANEYKHNLAKPGFKPRTIVSRANYARTYDESEQFAFHTVECKQLQKIVLAMLTNKAPGNDKIPMRVIKDSLPVILPTPRQLSTGSHSPLDNRMFSKTSADHERQSGMDQFHTQIVINSTGWNMWLTPVILYSSCKMDVKYFPFDAQACDLKFGSWTYDGFRMDMVPEALIADTSKFVSNGEWELISFPAKRNVIYYVCCPEPYPDVTYTLRIQRLALFYYMNLMIPCLLITVLTVTAFYLPPDSGERITLVITNLLAMTVFMLLVADIMPSTSEVIPVISIYFSGAIFEVSLALLATCFILKCHFHDPASSDMPVWIRHIVLKWMAQFLRVKVPRHRKQGTQELDHVTFLHRNKTPKEYGVNNKTKIENASTHITSSPDHTLATPPKDIQSLVKRISHSNLLNGNYKSGTGPREQESISKMTITQVEDWCIESSDASLSSNEYHGQRHNSETGTDGEVRKSLNDGDRSTEEILKMQEKLLECVQILTKEVAKNEDMQEKKDEWNTAVAILDRAFRMLFLLMFFLSTLTIFYFSMV
ncbi:Neuronal acetylcholine receptor subunit alpha-7 [Stylophora pistillata]|uniref:Neuronal acetylcholine receptor subunit alpha-7 n=1 Tax=Stylophora pistillata TaxID=50429 RepID=A0A2B4T1Q9_STYPI|nr:Neuronal acetylcholine receptor subunit alpha-7 [Stylophora pistillata]